MEDIALELILRNDAQVSLAPLEAAWHALPMDAARLVALPATRLLYIGLGHMYDRCASALLPRFVAFCVGKGARGDTPLAVIRDVEVPFDALIACVARTAHVQYNARMSDDICAPVVLTSYYASRAADAESAACIGSTVGPRMTESAKLLCTWMCGNYGNIGLLRQLHTIIGPSTYDRWLETSILSNNIAHVNAALSSLGYYWMPEMALLEYVIDRRAVGVAVRMCQQGGPWMRAQTGRYANAVGNTLLLRACKNGNLPVARVLLAECGADVNAANRFGETPLWWAAKNGHPGIVRLLLKRGATDADGAARRAAKAHGRASALYTMRATEGVRRWRAYYLARTIARIPGPALPQDVVRLIIGKVLV